jgi:pimeloyl-ACP methyl ester carboxylesterase
VPPPSSPSGSGKASAPAVEQVTRGPRRLGNLTFDRAVKTIAYTVGLHDSPGDIYASDIDGTHERRLTDINHDLMPEVALSTGERLQWKSADGTPIEGWLLAPANYDPARGPYPLIVVSHGGPHAATGYSFDFKKQFFAANGYFVLDTNFRSSTGYGDAFKWATWGEWGKKDGEDVMSGIDYVIRTHPIDPKRVGHTGHSYGGFMTNWLITQYPDRFAAAVTGDGDLELDERLRHGGHLSHEGNGVLRDPLGHGGARPDDPPVAARLRRQREDADAVRPRRGRSSRPLRGRGADEFRAQAPGHRRTNDPLCRPAARNRRALEQRAPYDQRARVVGTHT